jgi:hypothetical protein
MALPSLRMGFRLGLVSLCLLAGGCGGDGNLSEPEQIGKAVERAIISDDVKANCETAVTARFVREVYGSTVECRLANEPRAGDHTVAKAPTSDTRIDGLKATTRARIIVDGHVAADGRVALVKDGHTWRFDRYGVDFIRWFLTAFSKGPNVRAGGPACFARALRGMSGGELRREGDALLGGRLDDLSGDLLLCVSA